MWSLISHNIRASSLDIIFEELLQKWLGENMGETVRGGNEKKKSAKEITRLASAWHACTWRDAPGSFLFFCGAHYFWKIKDLVQELSTHSPISLLST